MIDRNEFRERGYLLMKGLFRKEEIEAIRSQAKEIFRLQMERLRLVPAGDLQEDEFDRGMFALFEQDLQAFINCGKQAQHLISLHKLSLDDRILRILGELGLTFPNVSTRPVLYFNARALAKKEVYFRLAPHQDWRSMQGSLDATVVWVPLVDVDRTLGALEVIPGSHKWGLLDAQMTDGYGNITAPPEDAQFVPTEVKQGDALFFSALLVHQSGINTSPTIRWSCHFRYNNLHEATFVDRGFPHPYIYKPQEELITGGFPRKDDLLKLFPDR